MSDKDTCDRSQKAGPLLRRQSDRRYALANRKSGVADLRRPRLGSKADEFAGASESNCNSADCGSGLWQAWVGKTLIGSTDDRGAGTLKREMKC